MIPPRSSPASVHSATVCAARRATAVAGCSSASLASCSPALAAPPSSAPGAGVRRFVSAGRARFVLSAGRVRRVVSAGRVRFVAVLALAGAFSACRDAPSDPLASLVSIETAPAVAVPVELPTLAELATRTDVRDELGPVLDAWVTGWEEEDEDLGRGVRDEAIRQATPALRDALGSGGVASTLQPLFEVGRDLGQIEDVPTDLVPRLEEVRSLIEDTRAALEDGRFDRALTAGLQASDRIRALGPHAVARTLISRADQALMRATVGETLDPRSMSRGERLLAGARRALEEGEVDLAIQRGYYAVQVLEGRGDAGG